MSASHGTSTLPRRLQLGVKSRPLAWSCRVSLSKWCSGCLQLPGRSWGGKYLLKKCDKCVLNCVEIRPRVLASSAFIEIQCDAESRWKHQIVPLCPTSSFVREEMFVLEPAVVLMAPDKVHHLFHCWVGAQRHTATTNSSVCLKVNGIQRVLVENDHAILSASNLYNVLHILHCNTATMKLSVQSQPSLWAKHFTSGKQQ